VPKQPATQRPIVPEIRVHGALAKWRMAPEATIDCDGFKAVVRFFGASNQLVQAEVAKRQNNTALSAGVEVATTLSDEEFKQDVESWVRIALVSWDMMSDPIVDDDGNVIQEPIPVPIEMASDIFCNHGIGGKELYSAMFQASRERQRFLITEEMAKEKN